MYMNCSWCVFETFSSKMYVFPGYYDKYQEDDINCQVVEQYMEFNFQVDKV